MAIDDGGPAFPKAHDSFKSSQRGMSLRDWFAGQALAGYTANVDTAFKDSDKIALYAVSDADALIAELAKGGV